MRLSRFSLLVFFASACFAQDTNFSTGPQYLIPGNSSPLLLQSIATPTVSLGEAAPATNNAAETAEPEQTAALPESSLTKMFWGGHASAETNALRLATPSMSLSQPASPATEAISETESGETPAGATTSAVQPSSLVEISSAPLPANLPPSIFNPGVTGTADTQSLLNRGYGMSLGELAVYWKANKRSASYVITNEELERKPRN